VTTTPTAPALFDAQALMDTACRAWDTGDAEALALKYADDGRLISPFGEDLRGREAIAAAFTQMFATMLAGTTTTFEVEDVRALAPGLTLVDGTQIVRGVHGSDGSVMPDWSLHFAAIVRQRGDHAEILEARPYAFTPLAPAP
jgi:uncharacterized protein (TIGR02246 family)